MRAPMPYAPGEIRKFLLQSEAFTELLHGGKVTTREVPDPLVKPHVTVAAVGHVGDDPMLRRLMIQVTRGCLAVMFPVLMRIQMSQHGTLPRRQGSCWEERRTSSSMICMRGLRRGLTDQFSFTTRVVEQTKFCITRLCGFRFI